MTQEAKPLKKKKREFSWDLGTATNNKAEALAALQGLRILSTLTTGKIASIGV